MHYRFAESEDAVALAPLNHRLISDEGHRNPMSVAELEARMRRWLEEGYRAVLVESQGRLVAYALFGYGPEYVYLRQLFVVCEFRRTGVGRQLVAWLRQNVWPVDVPVRLDVLIGNTAGQSFWRSVGFSEYCITMELPARNADQSFPNS